MSKHARYRRDRYDSHERDGHIEDDRYHRESNSVQQHDHYASYENDVWDRRHSDRDAINRPDQSYDSQYQEEYYGEQDRSVNDDQYRRRYTEHRDDNAEAHSAVIHPGDVNAGGYNSLPLEEDVWLREKQGRITFNDSDLRDVEFTGNNNSAKKLAAYAGTTAMLGLVVFLAFSSTPELSPLEIIAAEGYEGEQPTKTPFNLASLRDCAVGTECAKALESKVIPVSSSLQPSVSSPELSPESYTDTLPTTATQETLITVIDNNTTSITDEQVSISSTDNPVNNPINNPINKIELLEIAAVDSGLTNTEFTTTSSDAYINDTLTVLQQWSNVRETPDINGEISLSLDIGKTVTKIGQTGSWIEVRVDERPSVTGYMHRSTIAVR